MYFTARFSFECVCVITLRVITLIINLLKIDKLLVNNTRKKMTSQNYIEAALLQYLDLKLSEFEIRTIENRVREKEKYVFFSALPAQFLLLIDVNMIDLFYVQV